LAQAWADLGAALQSWMGTDAGLAWLHTNHLGAPEAATNAQGHVVWRAVYAPFGAAQVAAAHGSAFVLNLRLPGQVWDAETGLHYNRQRYYDPSQGQYLTPDPLGTPDGPNPYAYVAFNPLANIDPDGLVLFAFDGTGNDPSSQTNVQHFARSYADASAYDKEKGIDGMRYYERGPGTSTDDWTDKSVVGGGIAVRMRTIVNLQLERLNTYFVDRTKWEIEKAARFGQTYSKDQPLDIVVDVVGFSRGAAAAREFMNRVDELTRQGYYRQQVGGECARIKLRFAALFDTVLGTNIDFNMRMAIPASVQQVVHAVAVNEHRVLFPLESIEESYRNPGRSSHRIERGFVGAHSDIGGGYEPDDGGDLSDVALNWMVQQARANGVVMKELEPAQKTINNPIVHDPRRDAQWRVLGRDPLGIKDRVVRYRNASDVPFLVLLGIDSKYAPIQGLTEAEAQRLNFIQYRPLGITDIGDTRVGDVNMSNYLRWLEKNYGLTLQ
jgi:RHS repeat-associated protein